MPHSKFFKLLSSILKKQQKFKMNILRKKIILVYPQLLIFVLIWFDLDTVQIPRESQGDLTSDISILII